MGHENCHGKEKRAPKFASDNGLPDLMEVTVDRKMIFQSFPRKDTSNETENFSLRYDITIQGNSHVDLKDFFPFFFMAYALHGHCRETFFFFSFAGRFCTSL